MKLELTRWLGALQSRSCFRQKEQTLGKQRHIKELDILGGTHTVETN